MKGKWRTKVWLWLCRNLDPGCVLPKRHKAARAILFPIECAEAWLWDRHPYDLMSDEWVIRGVRYSNRSLRMLSLADGEVFRIHRKGDQLYFEKLEQSDE